MEKYGKSSSSSGKKSWQIQKICIHQKKEDTLLSKTDAQSMKNYWNFYL